MERTEKKLPFDNTSKPLKRQGFFESRFQNAPSFSSQGRYNHFDTAAYLFQTLSAVSLPADPHDFKSAE